MIGILKSVFSGNLLTVELENGQTLVTATEMAKPFDRHPAGFLRKNGTQEFIITGNTQVFDGGVTVG